MKLFPGYSTPATLPDPDFDDVDNATALAVDQVLHGHVFDASNELVPMKERPDPGFYGHVVKHLGSR